MGKTALLSLRTNDMGRGNGQTYNFRANSCILTYFENNEKMTILSILALCYILKQVRERYIINRKELIQLSAPITREVTKTTPKYHWTIVLSVLKLRIFVQLVMHAGHGNGQIVAETDQVYNIISVEHSI